MAVFRRLCSDAETWMSQFVSYPLFKWVWGIFGVVLAGKNSLALALSQYWVVVKLLVSSRRAEVLWRNIAPGDVANGR